LLAAGGGVLAAVSRLPSGGDCLRGGGVVGGPAARNVKRASHDARHVGRCFWPASSVRLTLCVLGNAHSTLDVTSYNVINSNSSYVTSAVRSESGW